MGKSVTRRASKTAASAAFGGKCPVSECNGDVTPIDQGTLAFVGARPKKRESLNAILPSGAVIGNLPD
jgi:hypothetical protein